MDMNELEFQIEIQASKEKVWQTLWRDDSFRQWAGLIDPGTYMIGVMKKGCELQFISSENGYGVTSLVEEMTVNEYLRLRHKADTQKSGEKSRENEWTGGSERYSLGETEEKTTLVVILDVPQEMEAYFKAAYPKALKRVKELAEKSSE